MQSVPADFHWRSRLFQCLRIVCAILLLGWVIQRVPWADLQTFSWRDLNGRMLFLAFILGGLSVLGWAGRWWWFLRVYGLRPRYGELLRLTLFADFFNLYFLGPLGADGIRLLLLSRSFPNRRGAVVGSLILDHVGGLFGGAMLYFLFSKHAMLPSSVLSVASLTLMISVGVTVLGLGVIMEPPIQRLIAHLPGLRWLSEKASPIYAGTFRHPWLFAGFAVSSLGTACAYAAFWSAAAAVGAEVSVSSMLGLMPVVDAIASLPITFSGIGIREGLLVEWLGDRTGEAQALIISLLGFAALGLWGLIGGLWLAFWRPRNPQTTA